MPSYKYKAGCDKGDVVDLIANNCEPTASVLRVMWQNLCTVSQVYVFCFISLLHDEAVTARGSGTYTYANLLRLASPFA